MVGDGNSRRGVAMIASHLAARFLLPALPERDDAADGDTTRGDSDFVTRFRQQQFASS